MAEQDRKKWNEKYEAKIRADVPRPNETLCSLASYFTGGFCLDVACGLGGNSLYLANHGYQVTALDVSDVAITYLQNQARQENLPVTAEQVDLDQVNLPEECYDLVVDTYFLDRKLFKSLKGAVKEGGYLFIETFYEAAGTNGNMNPQFKLKPYELRDLFANWTVFHFIQDEQKGIQSIFVQKILVDL